MKGTWFMGFVVSVCLLCAAPAALGQWPEQAKWVAPDPEANALFGCAVCVRGDHAIVGARGVGDGGAAYCFQRGAQGWTQTSTLCPAGLELQALFGCAVSISGDRAIIGALQDTTSGGYQEGAAYVYEYTTSGWGQTAKLFASDGNTLDGFGEAVSISGDCAIVGAGSDTHPVYQTDAGSAYVFERDASGWTNTAKLIGSTVSDYDHFGAAVSFDGTRALVGAYGGNAAYVFERTSQGWVETAELLPPEYQGAKAFGTSVSIDGSYAVVGAPTEDGQAGTAYVYEYGPQGWDHVATLTASDRDDYDQFGSSVAVDGTRMIVGARYDEDDGTSWNGSAYIFERGLSGWTEVAKITASDDPQSGEFGEAVSIDGINVLIGAPDATTVATGDGAAYLFVPEPATLALLAAGGLALLRRRRHS